MAKLALQVSDSHFIEFKTKAEPKAYQEFVNAFLEFLAERMKKRVKEVIRKQLYGWSPLSKTWKAFKKQYGLSPKMWLASGDLSGHFITWHSRIYDSWFVGVHPRRLHRKYKQGGVSTIRTKTPLTTIVRALEFGTSKIPSRPLFTKVFAEFQKNLNSHYIDFINTKGKPFLRRVPEAKLPIPELNR